MEILSPAGSQDSLVAAVQSGADSVYLGLSQFNARIGADNFTEQNLAQAVRYCHIRGVKVYAALNTVIFDRETDEFAHTVELVCSSGADGVIIADLGAARIVRSLAPELSLSASTQMTIHNLDGVKQLAEFGFSRAVLARELSKQQIETIAANSPIETEVFVHGAHCMCWSGQCYMSAHLGGRSGNRGRCAQPCRLPYTVFGKQSYPLSLKDLSLLTYVKELEQMGVTSLKIEGRMKNALYTGAVTKAYADAKNGRLEDAGAAQRLLSGVFSRSGFTDAYYRGEPGADMFGTRTNRNKEESRAVKADVLRDNHELPRIAVHIRFEADANSARLTITDSDNHQAIASCGVESAKNAPVQPDDIRDILSRLGGTPYHSSSIDTAVAENIYLSKSQLGALRRSATAELTELRGQVPPRRTGTAPVSPADLHRTDTPELEGVFTSSAQIPDECSLSRIWIPFDTLTESLARRYPAQIGLRLPRIIPDTQTRTVYETLRTAGEYGIKDVLIANPAQLLTTRQLGFNIHTDFSFNLCNSYALGELAQLGVCSAVAGLECTFRDLSAMRRPLALSIYAYGRMPLMIFQNCLWKAGAQCAASDCGRQEFLTIRDRYGVDFFVIKEYNCNNVLLNSKILFLADKPEPWQIGMQSLKLLFTLEDRERCSQVIRAFQSRTSLPGSDWTNGLYKSGVL